MSFREGGQSILEIWFCWAISEKKFEKFVADLFLSLYPYMTLKFLILIYAFVAQENSERVSNVLNSLQKLYEWMI